MRCPFTSLCSLFYFCSCLALILGFAAVQSVYGEEEQKNSTKTYAFGILPPVSLKDYCDARICQILKNCLFTGGTFNQEPSVTSELRPTLSDKNKEYAIQWDVDSFDRQLLFREGLKSDCDDYCRRNFVCGATTAETEGQQRDEESYRERAGALQKEVLQLELDASNAYGNIYIIEGQIIEVDQLIKDQLHSESQLSGEIKELVDGHKERSEILDRLKKQEQNLMASHASPQSSGGSSDGVELVDEQIQSVQTNVLSLQKHLNIVRNWMNVLSKSKTNVSADVKRLVAQYEEFINRKRVYERRKEELDLSVDEKHAELANMKKAREVARGV